MVIKDNPPYSLFQGEDDKWGTKDKDGKVYDEPIYLRSSVPGSENFFTDSHGLEVVEFDENEGMSLVVWASEPWYDLAWSVANYPKEYDDLLWRNIQNKRDLGKVDIKSIVNVTSKVSLSEEELSLLDLVRKYLEYEEAIEDNSIDIVEERAIENRVLNHSLYSKTADERVNILLPLMKNENLTEEDKSTLWYTLFELNDYLSCH